MILTRGITGTFLSLAAGSITIIAVGATGWPLVEQATQHALSHQADTLAAFARVSATTVEEEGASSLVRLQQQMHAKALLVLRSPTEPHMVVPAGSFDQVQAEIAACDITDVFDGQATRTPVLYRSEGSITQAACQPVIIEGQTHALVVVGGADFIRPLLEGEQRSRRLLLLLAGLAGLVVMLGVQLITRPVGAIARAAERIGAGERGVRVPEEGPPEIVDVSIAINALAQSVEAREDEIEARLNLVSQIMGTVAHELRNPLQSLAMLASLAKGEDDVGRRKEMIQRIEDEIIGMEGVLQRLLQETGPLRLHPRTTSLTNICKHAVDVARLHSRAKGIKISTRIDRALVGQLDGSLVRRAIENLLLNAVVWTKNEVHLVATTHPELNRFVIEVSDDGPGVAEEQRERIFEPYFSERPEGTGLGLSLVRQVFEAHDGTIVCMEGVHGGATFRGELPYDD